MTTPAQSYAAFRQRQRLTPLANFEASLDFPLDLYQRQACEALVDGQGVLVAAPTGAGKTVVGAFALELALQRGEKAFYTTPIKALSNQKYRDFSAQFGSDRVGLLTGDIAINPRAEVVVMTTEVLRNMMYTASPELANLGVVVLDEVHYLADRFRGPVWEEVLIQLPERVQMVCLSATVSNAEEFGEWLTAVRGQMVVVVSEHRPVPLWQHVLTNKGLLDLYLPGSPEAGPRLNPELAALSGGRRHGPGPRNGGRRGGPFGGRGAPLRSPPRFAVVEALDRDGLLPAIFFVFSRAGCEQAVEQCLGAGLRLTDRSQANQIGDLLDAATAAIPAADLDVLGYPAFRSAAQSGFAAHHAGLLPVFKEAIEIAFQQGLMKCVFATETLALGINMPARTVVMDRLDKWNGSEHAALTPGEYTQLTGRAGRRGIDVEGHGVVVVHRNFDSEVLASLASKRTYPLRSAFRPTYNMAVNLIDRVGRDQAREILELSFAQFQADRAIVGLARQVRQYDQAIVGYRQAMACDAGDVSEYMALRNSISQAEKQASRASAAARAAANQALLAQLRRGDIIRLKHGKYAGQVVIIEPGQPHSNNPAADAATGLSAGPPQPLALTQSGKIRRLPPGDLAGGITWLGHTTVPKKFTGRDARERQDMQARVRSSLSGPPASRPSDLSLTEVEADLGASQERIADLRRQLRRHRVHACPERETHARWAIRLARAERERAGINRRIEARTSSIARDFDRVCQVLTAAGYLELSDGVWRSNSAGQMLGRIYTERDILVAEALRNDAWQGAGPAELAALVTAVIYDSRRESEAATVRPPAALAAYLRATVAAGRTVAELEATAGVPITSELDAAACGPMLAWARGASLAAVLDSDLLTPGDFVRLASQVVDVLGQISQVAPSTVLRDNAKAAIAAVHRGVVRASPA